MRLTKLDILKVFLVSLIAIWIYFLFGKSFPFIFPVLALIITFLRPELGVFFTISVNPVISNIMGEDGGSGILVALLYFGVILGLFFKNLLRKEKTFKKLFGWGEEYTNGLQIIAILLLLILSNLIHGKIELTAFILLTFILVQFYISVSAFFFQNPEKISLLFLGVIISGVLTFLFSQFQIADLDYNNGRLAIDGGVRTLSNNLGLSLIVVIIFLSTGLQHINQGRYRIPLTTICIVSILTCSLGLILSASRGPTFGVILALLSTQFFRFKNVFKVRAQNKLIPLISACLIILAGFYFILIFEQNRFEDAFVYTIERLKGTEIQGELRLEIWSSALNNVGFENLFFGYGPKGFLQWSTVYSREGSLFYAHSVFVDTLFAGGLLALVFFLTIFWKFMAGFWKLKSALGIAFVIYIIISFSTHGTLHSTHFWNSLLCLNIYFVFLHHFSFLKNKSF